MFYKQTFGLPMGVLACIHLEFQEPGPFKCIILNIAGYFWYIDYILLIYP